MKKAKIDISLTTLKIDPSVMVKVKLYKFSITQKQNNHSKSLLQLNYGYLEIDLNYNLEVYYKVKSFFFYGIPYF